MILQVERRDTPGRFVWVNFDQVLFFEPFKGGTIIYFTPAGVEITTPETTESLVIRLGADD